MIFFSLHDKQKCKISPKNIFAFFTYNVLVKSQSLDKSPLNWTQSYLLKFKY